MDWLFGTGMRDDKFVLHSRQRFESRVGVVYYHLPIYPFGVIEITKFTATATIFQAFQRTCNIKIQIIRELGFLGQYRMEMVCRGAKEPTITSVSFGIEQQQ